MEPLEKKQKLIAVAIELYLNGQHKFTVKQLCQKAKINPGEFYRLFNSKNQVLRQFYPLCILRYRQMTAAIEDYPAMSLAEKLGNFIYTSIDLLQEQREFVDETIEEMVFRSSGRSPFHREVAAVFAEILESDSEMPDLQRTFLLNAQVYDFLTKEYLHLLRFWTRDDSPNFERSMALTDKLVGFLDEVLHSNVIGKGADLLKYFLQNNIIKIDLPLLKWFLNR